MKVNLIHLFIGIGYLHDTSAFTFFVPSIQQRQKIHQTHLFSTPFDTSLYDVDDDNDDDDNDVVDVNNESYIYNPYSKTSKSSSSSSSPLSVPSSTQLILGINKYSHDVTLCAANAKTGSVLFALSKERLSRTKHDSGTITSLVECCLDQLNLNLDSIIKVVMNNHHHRIIPLVEKNRFHMEWEIGLGINEGGREKEEGKNGYTDEENLLWNAQRLELSHHLAHAYSTAAQAPFQKGMIVIMDGMGETYRTMALAKEKNDDQYISDLLLIDDTDDNIKMIPKDISERAKTSIFDWREAESVYIFERKELSRSISIKPVFKRFVEERTPPTLYNHGFENMDSIGALYSRVSSHIFGDWNACGKVMGLAPWMGYQWKNDDNDDPKKQKEKGRRTAFPLKRHIIQGSLYKEKEDNDGDDGLMIDRSDIMGLPLIARMDPDLFDEEGNMKRRYDFDDDDDDNKLGQSSSNVAVTEQTETETEGRRLPAGVALDAISLSSQIQDDLESVVMDFVRHYKEKTGEDNLCLAGGVALNSVANGRLSRELGFEQVFIPPYPGDDGIAVGCCAFGLFGHEKFLQSSSPPVENRPKLWDGPLSPYLGPQPTEAEIKDAIDWAKPWLDVQVVRNEDLRYDQIARELASSGIVALFDGRSELGPRALGHRSILADPRKKGLVRFINEYVKFRESFRPFAPSVLAEEAADWFELDATVTNSGSSSSSSSSSNDVSPYMSITASVKKSKRDQIPAVTHVDGSSRLQTVTEQSEPNYHRLITTFFKRTGIPMVLNTSFNTLRGEPIVESPRDAIRSFLSSMGSIDMLVMGDYIIRRRDAEVRSLLGEAKMDGTMVKSPSYPKRTGPVEIETKYGLTLTNEEMMDSSLSTGGGGIQETTYVRMPDRPMHDENNNDGGKFQLLDELEIELLAMCDGTMGISEIFMHFLDRINDDDDDDDDDIDDDDDNDNSSKKAKRDKRKRANELRDNLFANVLRRLTRLFEHTLISW